MRTTPTTKIGYGAPRKLLHIRCADNQGKWDIQNEVAFSMANMPDPSAHHTLYISTMWPRYTKVVHKL